MYNNEPLECVESFKYLGREVSLNYRQNEYVVRHLEYEKRAYYAIENTCNHGEINYSVLEKYLFNILVISMLLYGVVGSLNQLRKSLKMSKSTFLQKFLQVKKQMSYTLLLETRSLPIDFMAMKKVVEYIHKV